MSAPASIFSPHLASFGASRQAAPPRHLGRRYNRDGVFQHEPGNTIVCHVLSGSATERALLDARDRYLAMPEARQLAFTAASSLHMTLFQGILEGRNQPPFWPADIAPDTPVERMTEIFRERLAGFPRLPGFAVKLVEALPTGLVLEGATTEDQHVLQGWRNELADRLGYRHPDHDGYVFHITFAYVIDWLDDGALPRWQGMLEAVAEEIRQRAPVIELKAPAFCSFEDMHHFEELLVLNPA